MNPNSNLPAIIDPLVSSLTTLSQEFRDFFDRAPTVPEPVEVLSEGIKWSRDGLCSDINNGNLQSLSPALSDPAKGQSGLRPHTAADLPDSLLAICCNTVSATSQRMMNAAGKNERPILAELCQALASGIKASPDNLFSDSVHASVTDLIPVVKKRGKTKIQPGDIIAVPAENEQLGFYAACVVTKNRFGTAYGFFKGPFHAVTDSQIRERPVHPYPIYSGEQCVVAGRWSVVGHNADLLALFPTEPEIFHRPTTLAQYGQGETASERLRTLTKEEAQGLGLLDGSYRQTYTCDFLQKRLPLLLKSV